MSSGRLGNNPSPRSWLQFCNLESVKRKTGKDILNPATVRWWGIFQCPEFPALDDDFDYTVQLGDRLDSLAVRWYGTEKLWWVIAAKNNIDDPVVSLHTGRNIVIPSPGYVKQNLLKKKVGSGR